MTKTTKSVTFASGTVVSCFTLPDGRQLGLGDPYQVKHYLGGAVVQVTADFDRFDHKDAVYLIARDQWGNTWCPRMEDVLPA